MATLETQSLYEINKQLMANEKTIDPILANQKLNQIAKKMIKDKGYYLLICPDLRQYVFFYVNPDNSTTTSAYSNLSEVLNNRGIIHDIDDLKESEGIWEIWIKDIYDNNLYMYQLTKYEAIEV